MSRLPEPGDVRAAFDRMDERAHATLPDTDDHRHDAGEMTFDPESVTISGPAAEKFRLAYGDLFVVEEAFSDGGLSLLTSAVESYVGEHDVVSIFASLMLQSMAIGALMERARWER